MQLTRFSIIISVFLILASTNPFLAAGKTAPKKDDLPSQNSPLPELVLKAGEYQETVPKEAVSQWISISTTLELGITHKAEIENIYFCPVNLIYCEMTETIRERSYTEKATKTSINEEEIQLYLKDLAKRADKDPEEAKFKMEDNKVVAFSDGGKGLKINLDESRKIIIETLLKNNTQGAEIKNEIELAYDTPAPQNQIGDINSLGITDLIGEGRSNFRGSPKNRIYNIKVGAARFNGVLIKPGEEFSFVKVLGPVDGEHGYLPELVIKKDKTEPEFGGGICQVSTTAFRAAIYSGLKITARTPHAYPVSYYNPQGMDATVYIPRPDLRFINNTPGYILIQTKIEGTELVFDFYGTSDGRKTEIIGPKITERNPDGSMKATFTQKVYDKDGNTFISDTFNSAYDSPSKYPHPGEEKITEKPKGWSDNEWKKYKKENGL
jgi:vancomycin resistance protein YoaR